MLQKPVKRYGDKQHNHDATRAVEGVLSSHPFKEAKSNYGRARTGISQWVKQTFASRRCVDGSYYDVLLACSNI